MYIQEDGSFRIEGYTTDPGIFSLSIRYKGKRGNVLLLIDKGSHLKVRLDQHHDELPCYEVEGDAQNVQLKEWLDYQMQHPSDYQYTINYVDTVSNPFIGMVAVSSLPKNSKYFDHYIQQNERLNQQHPHNASTKEFNQFVQMHKGLVNTQIGKIAPSIKGATPQGDTISLDSFKGKYVLINFWASWCRPCRRENPLLVKTYHAYKDHGFEIFSVSLDRNLEKWTGGIEADSLAWKGQICDFERWQSPVLQEYGVKSIPYNVLIDPNGKIIAKHLRGIKLDNKLKEVFDIIETSPSQH